jgi:hypothetical protein
MPTGPAARVLDPVLHMLPGTLMPGRGSLNVLIELAPWFQGVQSFTFEHQDGSIVVGFDGRALTFAPRAAGIA